jgi:1,4-dihydroxy-2-naphthoyl-CoA hydrolase
MTLADSVGAVCAFLHLPQGSTTATVQSQTSFVRPIASGRVRATARPIHVGRLFVLVQTEVRDEGGQLVALVTQTQAVVLPRTIEGQTEAAR